MRLHDEHMKRVDAVNEASTPQAKREARAFLEGFRDGVKAAGVKLDFIRCDLTQFERGLENREMCCGVFLDE